MSTYSEAGKGSKPRSMQDQTAYSSGWDRIFGKKKEDQTAKETQGLGDDATHETGQGKEARES